MSVTTANVELWLAIKLNKGAPLPVFRLFIARGKEKSKSWTSKAQCNGYS